jgi:hypothetical protein
MRGTKKKKRVRRGRRRKERRASERPKEKGEKSLLEFNHNFVPV